MHCPEDHCYHWLIPATRRKRTEKIIVIQPLPMRSSIEDSFPPNNQPVPTLGAFNTFPSTMKPAKRAAHTSKKLKTPSRHGWRSGEEERLIVGTINQKLSDKSLTWCQQVRKESPQESVNFPYTPTACPLGKTTYSPLPR